MSYFKEDGCITYGIDEIDGQLIYRRKDMAFSPSPKVAAARDYAKRFKQSHVVIFSIAEDGHFGYASYGRNMHECAEAKKLGDELFNAAERYFERDAGLRP